MGIGKTLSDILEEKGSNPNEISERTGIPSSTIYSIIRRDNMKVDITILAKICKALNVSMERFYNEYYSNDKTEDFILDEHEKRVITAYRNRPDMQPVVDKILDVGAEDDDVVYVYRAARGDGEDGWQLKSAAKMRQIENAPETDKDL